MYAALHPAVNPAAFHLTRPDEIIAGLIVGFAVIWILVKTDGLLIACFAVLAVIMVVVAVKENKPAPHPAAAARPRPAPTRTVIERIITHDHTTTRLVEHSGGLPPWAIVTIVIFVLGTACGLSWQLRRGGGES